MEDAPADPIQLEKIVIERTNGLPVERITTNCLSIAEADGYLRRQAVYAPAVGSETDRYNCTFIFSDGECFQMHLGLRHDHTLSGVSLSQTMRWTCEIYCGIERHLVSLDANELQKIIGQVKPEDRAQYTNWLNVYLPVVERDCQSLKTLERALRNYGAL